MEATILPRGRLDPSADDRRGYSRKELNPTRANHAKEHLANDLLGRENPYVPARQFNLSHQLFYQLGGPLPHTQRHDPLTHHLTTRKENLNRDLGI